ncbi:MAG TPA: endonuclease/exonuclease/phosphatase family protein [Bdellovibrionota bacterium]|nr:endonuclease/exonuclease/phosphatase family protein [Bdellovibrionota bacterium]
MELRLCELNLENLFISMEYWEGQDLVTMSEADWRKLALSQLRRKQKLLWKTQGLAAAIKDIAPDVLLLTEVGGKDSLESFNRHFLADAFDVHFVETNSQRGIDLGYLVRKGLGLRAETRSNRETPIEVLAYEGKYSARFSRDVAELWLHDGNGPRLAVLLTHLKSMISTDKDFRGKDVRTAEAIALAEIYRRLRESHPELPIVVGGDFNSPLSSLELELVSRTDLADFHDLIGTPEHERVSLVYFDVTEQPKHQILDYLMVSPHLAGRIVKEKSFTYRYKGFYGIPEEHPRTLKEKLRMPSDHYPLVLTLRI